MEMCTVVINFQHTKLFSVYVSLFQYSYLFIYLFIISIIISISIVIIISIIIIIIILYLLHICFIPVNLTDSVSS